MVIDNLLVINHAPDFRLMCLNLETQKKSDAQLRLVFENANETILVAQDDVLKYCNKQITELTGYSMSEVLSMNFSEFIHPDDLGLVLKEYKIRLSIELPQNKYSVRIITKKGEEKFISKSVAQRRSHGMDQKKKDF